MPSAVSAVASFITTVGGTAIGGAIADAVIGAGLSFAASEILGPDQPDVSGVGESLAQRLSMRKSPVQPQRVIYGKTKVGADLCFYDVNNDGKDLHMVAVFAGHECESIESIELNDDTLSLDGNGVAQGKYSKGNVVVNKHLGDQTTADSDLVNNVKVWDSDHVGYNKCYIYLRAEADNREDHRDLFPSGMPDIRAVVKGKNDIYDPRDQTTKYTNNSALCIRDFFTSQKWGYGFDTTQIHTDDVKNSANICDEVVDGVKRYTCNGTFRDDARNDMVIKNLLTSMAGNAVWSRGKERILAGAWRTPIDTYDEDNILAPIKQNTKRSRSELFNTARGTFSDPEQGYQPTSFPEVKESAFVNEDDGVTIPKTFELPFTANSDQAQRIARILLRDHRQQTNLETTLDVEAFQTQAGDNINLDIPRYDWSAKSFNIDNWTFRLENQGDGGGFAPVVDVRLTESAQSVYSDESIVATPITSPAVRFG